MKKILLPVAAVILVMVISIVDIFKTAEISVTTKQEKYSRVLAISPALEEIALALLEPENIIAVTDYSRSSPNKLIAAKANKVKNTIAEKPSTETIIALKPDIVLIPIVFTKAQADTLADCGVHVLPLDVPEGYEAIKQRISFIAKELCVETQGRQLTEAMDKHMNEIKERLEKVESPKVVAGYSINGVFGRKNGSFDNICKEAKAINGAGLFGLQRGEYLSKEQIIKLDPDVIICSASSVKSELYKEVLEDPAFKEIKAVKNSRVVIAEDRYMSSSTQYFVEAVDHLSKLIYPEYS